MVKVLPHYGGGFVTWHAIYGHSDKRTDVLDVRKVREGVTALHCGNMEAA